MGVLFSSGWAGQGERLPRHQDAEDKALLERLIGRADVFIQNLAPGAMKRAGFGSAELRAKHPRLITVDISGYGEEGEYATMKAYDLLVQAESGLAYVTGRAEGPGRVGVSACDIACGMHALCGGAGGAAVARHHRSGQGHRRVAVRRHGGLDDGAAVAVRRHGKNLPRIGLAHPSICPYGAFQTKDGQDVLIAIQNEARMGVLLRAFLMSRPAAEAGFT
jgi:crotonobetainyl-CoA:carnitine CoA-transferase CaiB-like acyl-CoA transferase